MRGQLGFVHVQEDVCVQVSVKVVACSGAESVGVVCIQACVCYVAYRRFCVYRGTFLYECYIRCCRVHHGLCELERQCCK